jgi:predicted nucleic acid-binding protein
VLRLGVPPAAFLPVVCDVTKDAEVAALPKIVAKRWPDSGIDVLVAAFCIEHNYLLLHRDRDYLAFEQHRGLRGWRH